MRTAARERTPLRGNDVSISGRDRKEIEDLYSAFRRGDAKFITPKGEARPLPDSLQAFLVDLIGSLNEAKFVSIVRNQASLTTAEAASVIGVSRQFLVNLLTEGQIPYHMVGSHRRIYAHDLLRYKAKRDADRRKTIRDLAKAEATEGLYGRTASADGE